MMYRAIREKGKRKAEKERIKEGKKSDGEILSDLPFTPLTLGDLFH